MEKIGELMGGLSIPISIRRANTPSSSDQSSEASPDNTPQAADDSEQRSPAAQYSALNPQSSNSCPHCGGAGWLRMQVPVGDPRFGKLYPCVCRTSATEERNLEDLYGLSNLDAFQHKVFANFDPEVDGANDAYAAAVDYATYPEGWLLLLGGFGSGKTHLAAAIANHVVQDHRMQVYFAVAPDLLHQLRAAYAPTSSITYDDRFEQIRSAYLLVIDDLGAEQSTPWAVEKLYQIFNHRYNNRLPTVVTTNSDLDNFDARVRSRLCDPDLCRHVFMSASDYRMRRMDPRFLGRGQPNKPDRPRGYKR